MAALSTGGHSRPPRPTTDANFNSNPSGWRQN